MNARFDHPKARVLLTENLCQILHTFLAHLKRFNKRIPCNIWISESRSIKSVPSFSKASHQWALSEPTTTLSPLQSWRRHFWLPSRDAYCFRPMKMVSGVHSATSADFYVQHGTALFHYWENTLGSCLGIAGASTISCIQKVYCLFEPQFTAMPTQYMVVIRASHALAATAIEIRLWHPISERSNQTLRRRTVRLAYSSGNCLQGRQFQTS